MAAQIVTRRHPSRLFSQYETEVDRDAELLAVITYEELESEGLRVPGQAGNRQLADGPVVISSDVLMGKMPKTDKILMKGDIWRLTSYYEWKPMHMALTTAGLFFSRPGQEALRDLIPLYEIVDVKKRGDIPGSDSTVSLGATDLSKATKNSSSIGSSLRRKTMANLLQNNDRETLHIIQVRTIENGYNSGRTYYLRLESLDACNDWLLLLRTAADRAFMLKKAGPSLFRRIRLRLSKYPGIFRFTLSLDIPGCVRAWAKHRIPHKQCMVGTACARYIATTPSRASSRRSSLAASWPTSSRPSSATTAAVAISSLQSRLTFYFCNDDDIMMMMVTMMILILRIRLIQKQR